MKIYKPEIIDLGEQVKIQTYFEYSEGSDYLWFLIDKQYSKYLTVEKLDGFLIALLPLAMQNGEDIYIEGAISEKLFYNVSHYYIKILSITIPQFKIIKIFKTSLDNGTSYECENAVGAPFSGGIDSFFTIYENLFNKEVPESYKITHFVFNNVGSHGECEEEKSVKIFNARFEAIKSFPLEINKDIIKINSNLREILNMNFQLTNTPRNISVILLLQKLFCKYYSPSSNSYRDCSIRPAADTGSSDAVTLSLLSTETLEFITDGSQVTRVEKTSILSEYEPTFRYLNVCVNENINGYNCSVCIKCCRTLLTLEILGEIDNYKNVFDLEQYKKRKAGYIAALLKAKKKPNSKEVVGLMLSTGFKIPLISRIKYFCIKYVFNKEAIKNVIGVKWTERIKKIHKSK